MSFFSDLFEGNFGNLGRDITQAPESFASHPAEWAETAGVIGAGALGLGALGAFGAAEAGGGALAAGGGDILSGGAGLGISDSAFAAASDAGSAALDAGGGALAESAADVVGAAPFDVGAADTSFAGGFTSDAIPVTTESVTPGVDTISAFAPNTTQIGSGAIDTSLLPPDFGGPVVPDASDAGFARLVPSATDTGLSGWQTPLGATDVPTSTVAGTPDPLAPGGGGPLGPGGGTGPSIDQTTLAAPNAQPGPQVITPQAAPAGDPLAAKPSGLEKALGGEGWGWKAAGLGAATAPLALTLMRGEQGLPPQANQLAGTNTALQGVANDALGRVQNNQLTGSQAAVIEQQRQDLTNKWRQVLFNQGVQNPEADSRWPQIQAQIEQQMQQQTQQMIQTTLQTALQASGQASSNLINLANLQVQQDTAFTNAIGGATRAIGGLSARAA